MPYADIERRRKVVRESQRRRRARLKAERQSKRPDAPASAPTLPAFIEGLIVPLGSHAGERLTLLPWECRFLAGAFDPGIDTAALSVARANGKTALVSAIATAALVGPLAVQRGECLIVASSFGQARISFGFVRDFMAPWVDAEPERWRVWDSSASARIEDRNTGAVVRCIGSDSRRAHGVAGARLVLADEPAQWLPNKSESMYSALSTSAGKVEGFRLIALGTRPASAGGWFARLLDAPGPGVYSQCHSADAQAPPFEPKTWERANPSLPHFPALRSAIEREAERAKLDGSLLPAFRALRLNLGVADTEARLLLEADSWAAIETDSLPPASGPYVLGFDLGASVSMTGAAAYWPNTGRLEAMAWFPDVPSLARRGLADGVGSLYLDLAERGELLTMPGRIVPPADALRWCLEAWGRPGCIAADRYKQSELAQALDGAGLTCPVSWRGQGWRDGGEDVRRFRGAVLAGRVAVSPSLLLRSQMAEATTVSDTAGNEKLSRASEGGRRQRAKDDAVAASILAIAEGERRGRTPPRPLRWAIV